MIFVVESDKHEEVAEVEILDRVSEKRLGATSEALVKQLKYTVGKLESS